MKNALPFLMPLLRSVLFIVGGLAFTAATKQELEEASRWWPILCSFYNIVTILLLAAACKYEGTTYRSIINYKKGELKTGTVVFVAIGMLFIGIAGMLAFGWLLFGELPSMLIKPIPVWVAAVNIIVFPVTIAFAEIPLYFGYSFNRIRERTGNAFFAMAYVIFFYALQHSFIPLLFDFNFMLFRFISFLPLLAGLGLYYYKKGKMATLMIGHGIMDVGTAIQILVLSISPLLYVA